MFKSYQILKKEHFFPPFLTQLFNVLRILHEHMDNLESTFLIFDEEPPSCVKQVPTEDYQNHPRRKKLHLFFFLWLRTPRKKSSYAKSIFIIELLQKKLICSPKWPHMDKNPPEKPETVAQGDGYFSLNFLLNCPIESFIVNLIVFFADIIMKTAWMKSEGICH